jgi:hypothetical protein
MMIRTIYIDRGSYTEETTPKRNVIRVVAELLDNARVGHATTVQTELVSVPPHRPAQR